MGPRRAKGGKATAVTISDFEAPPLLAWARSRPGAGSSATLGSGLRAIAPQLYLGNRQTAADRAILDKHSIKSVVCVGARAVFSDLKYHHIGVKDDGQESLYEFFREASAFIDAEIAAGGSVLVHCQGGISRSPAMVLGHLILAHGLCVAVAQEVLALGHPGAKPRDQFLKDLAVLEAEVAQEKTQGAAVPTTSLADEEGDAKKEAVSGA